MVTSLIKNRNTNKKISSALEINLVFVKEIWRTKWRNIHLDMWKHVWLEHANSKKGKTNNYLILVKHFYKKLFNYI